MSHAKYWLKKATLKIMHNKIEICVKKMKVEIKSCKACFDDGSFLLGLGYCWPYLDSLLQLSLF
jgi:hypothetical protein